MQIRPEVFSLTADGTDLIKGLYENYLQGFIPGLIFRRKCVT